MTYLAVPEMTAGWLSESPDVVAALARAIANHEFGPLTARDFYAAPLRLTGDEDIVGIVNQNHSAGTGDDRLGLIRVAGMFSISSFGTASAVMLSYAIEILVTRLSDREFDPETVVHRKIDETRHSLMCPPSGKMHEPLFLGWVERSVRSGHSPAEYRTLLICGPDVDGYGAADAAKHEMRHIEALLKRARELLNSDLRAILDPEYLYPVRRAIRRRYRDPQVRRNYTITALARKPELSSNDLYRTAKWTYEQWSDAELSTLTDEQRTILESDALHDHPLRLVGPAGTGKTLLMQLMAMRLLRQSSARVLYVTHNNAMQDRVRNQFMVLGGHEDGYLAEITGRLTVTTLQEFAASVLNLSAAHVFDRDPEKAKKDAFDYLRQAIDAALEANASIVARSAALHALIENETTRRYLDEYVRAEIGSAIKGRGLVLKRADYIYAAGDLGLFHRVLKPAERSVVYDAFERYSEALQSYGVMDADDIALSMLGPLLSPKWTIDRKELGFDFVFVDEAQLFNDNERKIFTLLTNAKRHHSPVAIALDASQRLYAPRPGGLALFGLDDARPMRLHLGHRLSEDIARLAFFVIAEGATIFDDDFPRDPTEYLEEGERLGEPRLPQLVIVPLERLARRVNRLVRMMRKEQLKQFAVIAHNAAAFEHLAGNDQLPTLMQDLDFSVLDQRGAERSVTHPYVLLSRPELIGGQEFDAVICCGLEEGLVPPRIEGNPGLMSTLEQQSRREMYLAFTRARHQLFIVNAKGSQPSTPLVNAIAAHRLELGDVG